MYFNPIKEASLVRFVVNCIVMIIINIKGIHYAYQFSWVRMNFGGSPVYVDVFGNLFKSLIQVWCQREFLKYFQSSTSCERFVHMGSPDDDDDPNHLDDNLDNQKINGNTFKLKWSIIPSRPSGWNLNFGSTHIISHTLL